MNLKQEHVSYHLSDRSFSSYLASEHVSVKPGIKGCILPVEVVWHSLNLVGIQDLKHLVRMSHRHHLPGSHTVEP